MTTFNNRVYGAAIIKSINSTMLSNLSTIPQLAVIWSGIGLLGLSKVTAIAGGGCWSLMLLMK